MSNGVSFDTLPEAKEYIEDLLREGYLANTEKKNGKYIVYRNKEKSDLKLLGATIDFGDESLIAYSRKPSTKTRLHEQGHLELGHRGNTTAEGYVKDEIDAERWARDRMDKKVNYNNIKVIALSVAEEFNMSGHQTYEMMKRVIKEKDVDITEQEQQELWNELKDIK